MLNRRLAKAPAAIACVLAILIAALGVAAVAEQSDQHLQTYEGVVTDTHCGAKHSAAIGKTAADCARACVHGGAEFALVDGDTIYRLEGDQMLFKRVAGQRVRVVGTLSGDRLTVTSISAI
ncbi:MAG: DUF5818 domain-containing protein [Candidatus Sulfotelmatobacter sp.]